MILEGGMEESSPETVVLTAWHIVCRYIAGGHSTEFAGCKEETDVFQRVRAEIEGQRGPSVSRAGSRQSSYVP